jgi:malonyl-CoA decarboxylase
MINIRYVKENPMIVSNLQPEFQTEWAELLRQDPVHPIDDKKGLVRRFGSDRIIYTMLYQGQPAAMLQVALTKTAPLTAKELWNKKEQEGPYSYAVFYSVFRLAGADGVKGGVKDIIFGAANDLQQRYPEITKFITLSPIPALRKNFKKNPDIDEVQEFIVNKKDPVARFHMSNGALPWAVRPKADLSTLRRAESWGWMASYDYTPLLNKTTEPVIEAPSLQSL